VTQNKLLYIRWPIASEVNIKNSTHNILYINSRYRRLVIVTTRLSR